MAFWLRGSLETSSPRLRTQRPCVPTTRGNVTTEESYLSGGLIVEVEGEGEEGIKNEKELEGNPTLFSSRSGTRTRVSTVRGWRANRYTNRPC